MKQDEPKEETKGLRPNFVQLVSDHFNGSSGDKATLYDVV
jgi:hypothetical protein